MTDIWLNETLYPHWGQRFAVKRELARVTSAFQDIVIFESGSHGRVMVLDGCIQITERDEFVYQEMIAHVPLLAHGDAERVLIIGAGDGGVLRRVLAHRNVSRVVMVEIDGEVIRLAREFLPAIGGGAWDDPRAEVIVGDGIAYVGAAPAASNAPLTLIVNDRSDTSVALAWTAAPGATAYRVERAGADGAFKPIGETPGLSIADSGLTPATAFSWRVIPQVNGVEQAASNSVQVSTLPGTVPCNAPGTCALAQ